MYGLTNHMIAASHPTIYAPPTMGLHLGEDPEVGAEAGQLMAMGWGPGQAIQRARQNVWARRQASCYRPNADMGADMMGADEDESDWEADADESEIDELGADDGEDLGEDPASLNGSIDRIDNRVQRIKAKIQQLEMKRDALPPYKRLKRNRLQRRIDRLRRTLGRKQDKLARKKEKFAARYGISPVVNGRGTAVDRTMQGFETAMSRANPIPTPNYTNAGGEEIVLPFFFDGEPYLLGSYSAGGGALQSLDISGQTRQKDYAQLFIKAVRISLAWQSDVSQANPNFNDVLLSGNVTSLIASGGFNLFYDTQPLDINHQVAGDGKQRITWQIDGLRDGALLRENATATLDGAVISLLNCATQIDAVVTAGLVCTRIADDWAGRRAA